MIICLSSGNHHSADSYAQINVDRVFQSPLSVPHEHMPVISIGMAAIVFADVVRLGEFI